jgi:23S rRNA pseudouridine2457 synthase
LAKQLAKIKRSKHARPVVLLFPFFAGMNRYFIIHKPFNMLSQFTGGRPDERQIGELDYDFPEGIHAVGRLDNHSEGLLILTTNKKVTRLLFQGEQPHGRTYLVRIKNVIKPEDLERLRTGVPIIITGGERYITPPCKVEIVQKPANLTDRVGELSDDYPHTWLLITLTEGKYHQVRKMVKSVHHPCQRLIRVSIEDLELGDLPPGAVQEIPEAEFFEKLKIANWN